jgi:isopenicillin-N epimerase
MTTIKDLFSLDPSVTFLNHGSFGACPKPVFQKYQTLQRRLEEQPVLFLGREFFNLDADARQVLAHYLHTDKDNLVFITNATEGVNIISHSLLLKPGDEILTTNHEYGACDYSWSFNCNKTGASYKCQPIHLPATSEDEIVDQLWMGVTPHTRVIYLSHITSPTALKFPVERICKRARLEGILTMIDGAHAPGQIELDMQVIDADFYTGNCHKWMLSPKGAGFLYVRPDRQSLVEPLHVSWGYHSETKTNCGSRFIDYFQWTGTKDPSASLTVPYAIQFLKDYHWDQIRVECHSLLHAAIQQICDLTKLQPLYPLKSDFYHQMGIAPLPHISDLPRLKTRLYDEFHVEVPLIQWQDRQFIRISIQGYNTEKDVDILLGALHVLLPQLAD